MNRALILSLVFLFLVGMGHSHLSAQKAVGKTTSVPMVLSGFDTIRLQKPDTLSGVPLLQAAQQRRTARDFKSMNLSTKHLSEVLWMAYGVNRPNGKRTVPSARALYPLRVYAVLSNGIYYYNPAKHILEPVAQGDYRGLCGVQDFVATAPLNLIFVSDIFKYGDPQKVPETTRIKISAIDAGHCTQNVYLYCASEKLSCVERAMVSEDELLKVLQLDDKFRFIIAQTVGY